jgi:hypothetical protein
MTGSDGPWDVRAVATPSVAVAVGPLRSVPNAARSYVGPTHHLRASVRPTVVLLRP